MNEHKKQPFYLEIEMNTVIFASLVITNNCRVTGHKLIYLERQWNYWIKTIHLINYLKYVPSYFQRTCMYIHEITLIIWIQLDKYCYMPCVIAVLVRSFKYFFRGPSCSGLSYDTNNTVVILSDKLKTWKTHLSIAR